MIAACIPLELKRGHVTACRSIPHVDFSEPAAIDMEAQVNASHQLRGLFPDLVNKRMNTNTRNKPSTLLYRKFVVGQMIFSTHCIVVKLTYDMRGLTYFLTFEVNIMPFFLLGSSWVLPLRGESSNKLQGLGYIWEMNEQSTIMFKKSVFQQGVKTKDF